MEKQHLMMPLVVVYFCFDLIMVRDMPIVSERICEPIKVLASDEFERRQTVTPEEEKTILLSFFNMREVQSRADLMTLQSLIGSWTHETVQIISNGNAIKEFGTAEIDFILNSSFVRLQVELHRKDNNRSYMQLIGFDKTTRKFESTYFYNGTTITVKESGYWFYGENRLELTGVNPWSEHLENDINIKSTIQINSKDEFQLEVLELRVDGRWIKGYNSIFTRKT